MILDSKRNASPETKSPSGGILFFSILILEFLFILWLVINRRYATHDTFQHFNTFYYFLNESALYGEIPQWNPFIMHGMPFSSWYLLQESAGLLLQVLFHAGGLIRNANALIILYADILFSHFILLLGTWLLAKRFFSSPYTVFFVSISVMGSCIWYSQIHFNFAFYYSIPLIIYLFHTFLDSGQWRYLFAAFNLWAVQSLTILAYFIPVTSFIIFVYFFSYSIFNFRECRSKIRNLNFKSWPFLWCIAGMLLSSLLLCILFIARDPQTVSGSMERAKDFSISLSTFLTHGGSQGINKWAELFLRASWMVDTTRYVGLLTVILALYSLIFCFGRKTLSLLLTIIILLSFTMGKHAAVLAYHFWPLMRYYRHIGLISPAIKLFLCFLAGFGFEAIFIKGLTGKKRKILLPVLSFVFLQFSGFYLWANNNPDVVSTLRIFIGKGQWFFPASFMSRLFGVAAALSLLLSIFWLSFFIFRKRLSAPFFIVVILLIHATDLYAYKFGQMQSRTCPVTESQYEKMRFEKIPFVKTRKISVGKENPSERINILGPITRSCYGIKYSIFNAFVFADELGSSGVTHIWPKPLSQYFRAYGGQSFDEAGVQAPGYKKGRFTFLSDHTGALKMSGVKEEKIQFFSAAHEAPAEQVASYITDREYAGDVLFVSSLPSAAGTDFSPQRWSGNISLADDQRLHLPYEIKRFSSNYLDIAVDTAGKENIWFFYADTWHPQWKAIVNGKPAPVFKANLAYKAIPLTAGPNIIHLRFYSPMLAFMQLAIGLCSLAWIGVSFLLLRRI